MGTIPRNVLVCPEATFREFLKRYMRFRKREHLNILFNNYTFENMTDVAVLVDPGGRITRKVTDSITEGMRFTAKYVTTMTLLLRSAMRQDQIRNSWMDCFT